jgi:L-fuconolactonase
LTKIGRRQFLVSLAASARAAEPHPKIDAHHHFWSYNPKEYSWVSEQVLKGDFGPRELESEMTREGIQGAIPVQARSSLKETDWLLSLAESHDFIRGVVGWLPVADPGLPDLLERYASKPALRGIRIGVDPGAQGDRRRRFEDGLQRIGRAGLSLDLLISQDQLGAAIDLADRLPDLTFVIDHLAKPRIKDHVLSPWRENIREAAKRPNVYAKLSGLVNAADYGSWTEQDLRPYIDVALEAFGARRLMFGSDWPVCLVAATYERWYTTARRLTAALSPDEQDWVFGRAAAAAYRLSALPADAPR